MMAKTFVENAMRKIMLLGDTHGNGPWVNRMLKRAEYLGCDTVVQLGDFGFWEHMTKGVEFLKNVSQWSQKRGIEFYWIDGNHENFDILLGGGYMAAKYAPFWKIRESLFYIPRGTVWEWESFTFAAMGGAVSIDKDYRTPGYSWWEQETIRDQDVDKLESNVAGREPIDFLLTHDAPKLPDTGRMDYKLDRASENHRNIVKHVVDVCRPRHIFHGHYHYFHRSEYRLENGWKVDWLGLDKDESHRCYAILELDDGAKKLSFPWDHKA